MLISVPKNLTPKYPPLPSPRPATPSPYLSVRYPPFINLPGILLPVLLPLCYQKRSATLNIEAPDDKASTGNTVLMPRCLVVEVIQNRQTGKMTKGRTAHGLDTDLAVDSKALQCARDLIRDECAWTITADARSVY